MIAVEIDFLTGRYSATAHDDRRAPEWPVHPHRLFSALVATWAEAGQDAGERAALEWLEQQQPPAITCSAAGQRRSGPSYVPVNDAAVVRDMSRSYDKLSDALEAERIARDEGDAKVMAKSTRQVEKLRAKAITDSGKAGAASGATASTGLAVLPDSRPRQARDYPTVIPDDPKVTLVWATADPTDELRSSLDVMLERVHRLGHSSSFVACRLINEAVEPTLVPDDRGGQTIRVPRAGLLAELEVAYAAHRGEDPRVLPSRQIGYGPVKHTGHTPESTFGGDWVALEIVGKRQFPVQRAVELARAVRSSLLRHHPDPLPEFLSGHQPGPGGRTPATTSPHLAVVSLPFVGNKHADGSLQGVALVLPRVATRADRAAIDLAVANWAASDPDGDLPVFLGRSGTLKLRPTTPASSSVTLRSGRWSRASGRWATATPVALDRHPGDLWTAEPRRRERARTEAVESVIAACSNIGLPPPVDVALDRTGRLRGSAAISRHQGFQGGRGPRRALVHVRLDFAEPVAGPVILGAGRHLGLGLLFPTPERGEVR